MLDLVEGARRALDGGNITLGVFTNFSIVFNSLFTSYILETMLGADLSKESPMWIVDFFTQRFFAVIQNRGPCLSGLNFGETPVRHRVGVGCSTIVRVLIYPITYHWIADPICLLTIKSLSLIVFPTT